MKLSELHHQKFTLSLAVLLMVMGLVPTISAQGTVLPAGFTETLITNHVSSPTTMTFSPDGRLFVSEKSGQLRIIKNGVLLPTPFLSLSVDSLGERGLLGVEFDPDFVDNQYIYIYYTVPTVPPHNRVSRFIANGDVVLPGSEVVLLDLNNLGPSNHNGGSIHFGPDGKLYIAAGENGTSSNAQSFSNLLGKILRINSDGSIPTDNPFYTTASGQNRAIWALGLRNPFTFAFQNGTGRLFINDVGQNTWEEIDDGIAGSNYGWPTTEGPTNNPNFRAPLYAYTHASGCAITGGDFYNPAVIQFPSDYVGTYFFADYCGGWIKRMDTSTYTVQDFDTTTPGQVVDLDVDNPSGDLYFLMRGPTSSTGAVYRISYTTGVVPPTITLNPDSQIVPENGAVPFSCAGQGTIPLTYQWQRNNVDIPGATASSYTLPSAAISDDGAAFHCVISNTAGSTTSDDALLTVVAGGHRPDAQIVTPTVGTTYTAGETITYSGSASDTEDGVLPPSAYTWEVIFHHDAHTHPFIAPHSGVTSDTFTTADTSHGSINIWYRIQLTVTDSTNLTRTVFVDVHPQTVHITLQSVPSGLEVDVDGQPHFTRYVWDEVVGANMNLTAPTRQVTGNTAWAFWAWSDGSSASHPLVIPAVAATYTATYLSCPVPQNSANAAPPPNYFTTSTPTLTWSRLSWATGYEVQVDNDPSFRTPEYDNAEIPGTNLYVTIDALPNCLYYWRVRGQHANSSWGGWSAGQPLVIDAP
jgi:glucose/arabinose dehydrogenase